MTFKYEEITESEKRNKYVFMVRELGGFGTTLLWNVFIIKI